MDNGCLQARAAGLPLKTSYAGSQLDFAVSFLQSHPHTRLVTLSLGANDLFLFGHPTPTGCASQAEFDAALTVYEQNLRTILTAIRNVYDGKLVAVTYYSVDYRDPQITGSITALNGVETRLTREFRGTTADGFEAFAAVRGPQGRQHLCDRAPDQVAGRYLRRPSQCSRCEAARPHIGRGRPSPSA